MKVDFLELAEQDVQDAVRYYRAQAEGLDERFLCALRDGITLITRYPHASPPWLGEIRRCLLQTFPYGVVYEVEEDRIVIYAVMHLHRRPVR